MEIISCSRSKIVIKLGEEFSNVTISAIGERICDYAGFCIYRDSIKQIEPFEKALTAEDRETIATAIFNCTSFIMSKKFVEFIRLH